MKIIKKKLKQEVYQLSPFCFLQFRKQLKVEAKTRRFRYKEMSLLSVIKQGIEKCMKTTRHNNNHLGQL